MAKQVIGVGTVANDGTGDAFRTCMIKCNDNFTELYDAIANGVIGGSIADNQVAVGSATADSIEGDVGLTYTPSYLKIGVNDTTVGQLAIYGSAATSGGLIDFYNGATADTNDDFYRIRAFGGEFEIYGNLSGTFLKYNSANQDITIPDYGGGTVTGTLAYGLGVTSAGLIIEYNAVTKVGTPLVDQVGVWTGDGTLEGATSLKYNQSIASLSIGVDDLVQGDIILYGDNVGFGGKIRLHNGATGDTNDEYYDIHADSGAFTIFGATSGTFFSYSSANQDITFPDYGSGTVTGTATYMLAVTSAGLIVERGLAPTITGTPASNQVATWNDTDELDADVGFTYSLGQVGIGVSDTTQGVLRIYGNAAAAGGYIQLYCGATADTFNDYYTLNTLSGDFILEGSITGDFFKFDASADTIDITASTVTMVDGTLHLGSYITTRGLLRVYGDTTTGGGQIQIFNGDTVNTENDSFYIEGDSGGDFKIRGITTGEFYRYDSGTKVTWLREGSLNLGNADTIGGIVQVLGGAATQGGIMRIFNGASSDTTDDYYTVEANSAQFRISGASTGQFFMYSTANQDITIADYGSGTVTGTLAYILGVTSAGLIIEESVADLKPTLTKSITIENPTGSENIAIWFTPVAITITNIQSAIVGSNSVTIDPVHGTNRATATNDILSTPQSISSTSGVSDTSFADATIPANSWVVMITTAVSGSPTQLTCTFTYTED